MAGNNRLASVNSYAPLCAAKTVRRAATFRRRGGAAPRLGRFMTLYAHKRTQAARVAVTGGPPARAGPRRRLVAVFAAALWTVSYARANKRSKAPLR